MVMVMVVVMLRVITHMLGIRGMHYRTAARSWRPKVWRPKVSPIACQHHSSVVFDKIWARRVWPPDLR